MKIAINDLKYIDKFKNEELIFVFDEEPLEELIKTGLRCINRKYINNLEEVDYNLTNYNGINCIKKIDLNNGNFEFPKIKKHKFAIIVPNYNYENCLKKCLGSILEQTYSDFEIIFVDDCSTDNSVKVAKTMLKNPHKVIELKQKRLNGGSRNEAYLHISDDVDYVYYVDSDDWLKDEHSLEKINMALVDNPDVLFVGLAKYKNGRINPSRIPDYSNRYEAMQGWSGSSGKVIKRELATRQECLYPEGTLKEDRNQHYRICINMKTFGILPHQICVWNQENHKSVTTVREKNILWKTSTIKHYADTLQLYLEEKGKDSEVDKLLERRVNLTKKEMEEGGDQQW